MASTLIVGMGPAGLVTALQLLKKGHKITLIDKRPSPFERDRTISLHAKFVELLLEQLSDLKWDAWKIVHKDPYIKGEWGFDLIHIKSKKKLSELLPALNDPERQSKLQQLAEEFHISIIDIEFFSKLIQSNSTIKIYEIQDYFFAKAQEMKMVAGNNSLEVHYSTSAQRAHQQGVQISKEDGETIYLKPQNLVICPGYPNPDAQLDIHKALSEGPPLELQYLGVHDSDRIRFEKTHVDHSLSAVIQIHCPSNLLADIEPSLMAELHKLVAPIIRFSHMHLEHLVELKRLGWTEDRLPELFIQFHVDDKTGAAKFYLAGEVPDSWQGEHLDSEAVKRFVLGVLKIEYPAIATKIDEFYDQFTFPTPKQPADIFVVQPSRLPQPYADVDDMHVFFAGDIAMSSNFYLGHGFEKAVRMALSIADCFDAKGAFISFKDFAGECARLAREYVTRLNHYRLATSTREQPLRGEVVSHIGYYLESYGQAKREFRRNVHRSLGWMYRKPSISSNGGSFTSDAEISANHADTPDNSKSPKLRDS